MYSVVQALSDIVLAARTAVTYTLHNQSQWRTKDLFSDDYEEAELGK